MPRWIGWKCIVWATLVFLPATALAQLRPGYCRGKHQDLAALDAKLSDAEVKQAVERVAQVFEKAVDPADRARFLQRVRGLAPDRLSGVGVTLVSAGVRDPGLLYVAAAARQAPLDLVALGNLATFAVRERRAREDGGKLLRAVVDRAPMSAPGLANYAAQAFEWGDYPRAKEAFQKALVLEPAFDSAHAGLASTARCLGDEVLAEAELAKLSPKRLVAVRRAVRPETVPPRPPPDPSGKPAPAAPRIEGDSPADDKARDERYRSQTVPPLIGVVLGVGRRPRIPVIPSSAEVTQMMELKPQLAALVAYAQQRQEEERAKSKDFEREAIGHQWFVYSRHDWTPRRFGSMSDAALIPFKGLDEQEQRARQALAREQTHWPRQSDYDAHLLACGSAGEAQVVPCQNAATRQYCAELKGAHQAQWDRRYTLWASFTTAYLKGASEQFYRITDAAYGWLDQDEYRRSNHYANQELWGVVANRGGQLLGITETVPVQILLTEDPYWCAPEKTHVLPEAAPPKVEAGGYFNDFCQDWMKVNLDAYVGSLTVGCAQVELELRDGPLFAKFQYDYASESFTLYGGVGGKLKDAIDLEAQAWVTVGPNGVTDVGVEATAKVAGALEASAKYTGETGGHLQVVAVNETVFEATFP